MKFIKSKFLVSLLAAGILFTGCEAVSNTNKAQRGAAIGAAGGALLGGILGNNIGHGNSTVGILAGTVVGGVAGGLIGHKMDEQAKKIETTLPGATVNRTEEGIQVILDENSNVKFEYNSADLTPTAKDNLHKLVNIFKEYPDTYITIIGYTDNVGSQAYNLPLSERRATSVEHYLESQGIASNRLLAIGRGLDDPIASNDTAEGRAQNRRVEFAIRANEKMIHDAEQQAGQ